MCCLGCKKDDSSAREAEQARRAKAWLTAYEKAELKVSYALNLRMKTNTSDSPIDLAEFSDSGEGTFKVAVNGSTAQTIYTLNNVDALASSLLGTKKSLADDTYTLSTIFHDFNVKEEGKELTITSYSLESVTLSSQKKKESLAEAQGATFHITESELLQLNVEESSYTIKGVIKVPSSEAKVLFPTLKIALSIPFLSPKEISIDFTFSLKEKIIR